MFGWLFRKRDDWEDYYRDDPGASNRQRESRRSPQPRLIVHFFVIGLLGAVVVGAIAATSGAMMASKLLQSLATPVAIVWILLFLSAYSLTICRVGMGSIAAWGAWLILTLTGNAFVSNQIVMTLERPFFDDQPLEEAPFDIIVVLGGGTKTSPNGQPQLSLAGDRIMLAARLVELGKVDHVICTGSHWQPPVEKDMDYNDEAMRIIKSLHQEATVTRLKGVNTMQEMESLAEWLEDHPKQRIGVVTSAWHLPRALRLAQLNGIQCVGLPCDFRTRPYRPEPTLLVPASLHIENSQVAIREHLARIAGQ